MNRRRTIALRNALPPALSLALFAAACTLGLATAPPVAAQAQTRAYAPEQLWQLTPAEQRRVIGLEYSEQSRGRAIPEDQMRFYLDQVRLSHWTFSRIKTDIAQSLGGSGWNPPVDSGTVRCESNDSRQRTCPTPWRSGSRLVRQLSNTRCIEGQNWSSTPGQVWVRGGCRADFAEADWNDGGIGEEIRCESDNGRYRQCGTGRYGEASLVRQLSGTRCVRNGNWGLTNGALWVDGGCRGVFRVGRGYGDGDNGGYNVTCSSQDNRRTTCAWDIGRGMPRLLQQLSSQPCIQGQSWGYALRGGLWVDRGCRARFGVR